MRHPRKVGKARWVFECEPCNERVEAIDEFRAIEYGQWHEKSYQHTFTIAGRAFQVLVDAFTEIVTPALDVASSFSKFFEAPRNRPHDPSLLSDRRKWGGR